MYKHLIFAFIFVLHLTALPAQQQNARSVLLVIDMQDQWTKHQMDSVVSGKLIENINEAIIEARPMDIIFFQTEIQVLNISLRGI